jgi:hypothetical protein
LCLLSYLSLWPCTWFFTMLKVHSHLCSASGYHLHINFIILSLILA